MEELETREMPEVRRARERRERRQRVARRIQWDVVVFIIMLGVILAMNAAVGDPAVVLR